MANVIALDTIDHISNQEKMVSYLETVDQLLTEVRSLNTASIPSNYEDSYEYQFGELLEGVVTIAKGQVVELIKLNDALGVYTNNQITNDAKPLVE